MCSLIMKKRSRQIKDVKGREPDLLGSIITISSGINKEL